MILFRVGSGRVGSGRLGMDDGNSDNRANSVQPKLKLGLSLAISETFSSNSSKVKSSNILRCKKCDYATKRKGYFNDHKTTSHNWCFICYSSYTSQDDLKKHFKKSHSKALGCLEGKIGKAHR